MSKQAFHCFLLLCKACCYCMISLYSILVSRTFKTSGKLDTFSLDMYSQIMLKLTFSSLHQMSASSKDFRILRSQNFVCNLLQLPAM